MIALKIPEVKDFMNKLLCQDVFDHFLIQETVIRTNVSYQIDGTLCAGFYSDEELDEYGLAGLSFVPYGMLRGQCFQLIRGKKTPSYFKFSFLLSPDNLSRTLAAGSSAFTGNDVSAIFFCIRFQNGALTLTTGISYRIFSTDKTLEHEWDELLKKFLKKHGIFWEEL